MEYIFLLTFVFIVIANRNVTLKQKSLTLPLIGTSSPILVVPDKTNELHTDLIASNMKTKTSLSYRGAKGTPTPKSDDSTSEMNRVGQSVFYDCMDSATAAIRVATVDRAAGDSQEIKEKQDIMKPEKNDTDEESKCLFISFCFLDSNRVFYDVHVRAFLSTVSEIDQGCTIFSGVTYLGRSNINAPKSEGEVYRIMSELNSGSCSEGVKISISIPNCSDGLVV